MANKVQEIIEQQVLTVAKAVEDKIDDEIAALEKLDLDDIEVLRERRLQQMKKMAEKRTRWVALGHGEYTEIFREKDFFTIVKASDRVVCHFYRENWPCKERNLRIFQGKRTLEDVFNIIKDVVRLRIMSLNVNASFQVQEVADTWEFFVWKSNRLKKVKFIDGRSKR